MSIRPLDTRDEHRDDITRTNVFKSMMSTDIISNASRHLYVCHVDRCVRVDMG